MDIVAKQHGGSYHPDKLALACHRCNLQKGQTSRGAGWRSGRSNHKVGRHPAAALDCHSAVYLARHFAGLLKNRRLAASERASTMSGQPSPSRSAAANPYIAPWLSPKVTRLYFRPLPTLK